MTGHALEEEQTGLLVQDGVRGPACVTCDVLFDVPPEDILNMLLLKPSLHDQLVAAVHGSTCTQLSKQES